MPLTPNNVASYRDIQDKYDELQQTHPDLVSGMSMHDYSQHLNEQTNSHNFDAGLNPNMVKDASAMVDRGLDATGVTGLTGGVGKALGGLISPQAAQVGEEYGRGFVRPLAAGLVGAGIGTLLAPGAGTLAGGVEGLEAGGAGEAAGLAAQAAARYGIAGSNIGYGANQALQTYTDTDSKTAAAAAGVLGYATHGFGEAGENIAAATIGRRVGSAAVEGVGQVSKEGVMPTLVELATEKFGLTAGLAVNNEVTRQAVNVALGHGLTMPSTGDAVSDIANAAAPLVLGLGHDLIGLHDAQQPGRDIRSRSEAMNVVAAAQAIRIQQVKTDAARDSLAATITLDQTKQADAQRATAINMDDVVSRVLRPEDASRYNAEQEPVDRGRTVLGRPITEYGSTTPEATPSLDVPISKIIGTQNEQTQPTETPQAAATTPSDNKPANETQNAAAVGGGAAVEQPETNQRVEQLPTPVKQVVRQVPPPITLESAIAKASLLNKLSDVPKLDAFQDLVHLHTELLKQLADDPTMRTSLNISPITDKSLSDQVAHLMSKEGGSMKSLDALNTIYNAARSHLRDKYKEFSARQAEQNEQTNVQNKQTLAKQEQDEALAVAQTKVPHARDYVLQAMDGPFGKHIQDFLDGGPELPMNTMVAIERWERQTSLNNDPDARKVLHLIHDQQRTLQRRLKPQELQLLLSTHPELSHSAIDNITTLWERKGALWNSDGTLAAKGKLNALLKDDVKNPGRGSWNMTLEQYVAAAVRREKVEQEGTTSLDKSHTEDGETTLAHTDLLNQQKEQALLAHVDEKAKRVSEELSGVRLEQTKLIRSRIEQMGVGRANQPDNEMARIHQVVGKVVKDDLPRFKKLLTSWADATSLLESQRQLSTGKGGLDHFLLNSKNPDGTFTYPEWRQVGDSNMSRRKKECREFYDAFTELDKNGVPQIKERFREPDWYKPQQKPEIKAGVSIPQQAETPSRNFALEQEGREKQAALMMHAWFTGYLKQSGLDESSPMFNRYRESMVRVALLFPQLDKARIAGIVGEQGQRVPQGLHTRIDLDPRSGFSKFVDFIGFAYGKVGDSASNIFFKNIVGVHEFHHAIFAAWRAGELTPDLMAKMGFAMDWAKNTTPEDRAQILNSLVQFLLPSELYTKSPRNDTIRKSMQDWVQYGIQGGNQSTGYDPEEFLSTMFSFMSVGVANPAKSTAAIKNIRELMDFIPDRLQQFNRAYYTDLLHYSRAIEGYFNETRPDIGKSYGEISKMYQELVRSSSAIDTAMKAVNELISNSPENYVKLGLSPDLVYTGETADKASVSFAKTSQAMYGLQPDSHIKAGMMIAEAKKLILPGQKDVETYGHNPGFWSLFTPLAQFAERFPVMRPLADTLLNYEGIVNSANAQALSPFAMTEKNGKMVKTENFDVLKAVKNHPVTGPALNSLLLWQNSNEASVTAENIGKLAPQLSAKQQVDVIRVIENISTMMTTSGQSTINASLTSCGHLIGSLAMNMEKTRAMTAKTGEQVGTNLMKALVGLRSPDAVTQQTSQQLLASVMGQMLPETGAHILQAGQALAEKHAKLIDMMTNRPWHSPESRPGEFGMYYEKGDKPGFTSFKTQQEAVAARDKYSSMPDVKGVRLINPYKNQAPGAKYSEASVMHFVDLEQTAFQTAQKIFGQDPSGLEKMQEFAKLYQPGSEMIKELGSQGIRKNMQERKLVQGREDIDMLSNALNYVVGTSRANAKSFIRSKTLLQGQDPTLINEPRLKGLFNDHMNAVLNPPSTSAVWGNLKKATIMYYIGGNLSTAMSETLQPIQATLPHLTRNGVGIVAGMKYFADANKILFNAFGRGKGIQDPVLAQAFKKALTDRVVGFSNVLTQFDHNDDSFVARMQNFANDSGDSGITGGKLLQNVAYHATRVLGYVEKHTIDHNTRVAFISGFNAFRDIGTKQGLSGEALSEYAYSEAKRTVEESLHTGGAASRPLGFGKVGNLTGVAGALYCLNHFNFSMISIMARYGLEAIGHTGLEGAALHNARKAFGQALVTQLALSGAMGLPFAGAAVAMIEELFPNLQLNRDMRTAIASLAGDDHQAGGILADASLKGLATAFSPVDVSGRLGLGAVVGSDPYYGFDAKDVLGASGSMFANMVKGVQKVATGDMSGGMNFLPNSFQRMYKAAADGGAVRNAQGQVVFQPTDAQRVLMAIGLRPKDEAHAKEESMMDERAQTIQSRQLSQWYSKQEDAITSGRYEDVKTALYQKAQEDPTFSPLVALKRIVAGAQKSQVVQSPVDKGSASQLRTREAIGQTFGQPTTAQRQPTQVSQLIAREQLERQVGIPGAGQIGQAEMATAHLTDYMMQKYNLDEAQAKQIVLQMHQEHRPSFSRFHEGEQNPLQSLANLPSH